VSDYEPDVFFDTEELDTEREDLSLVGKGYKSPCSGPMCPRCSSINTSYSGLHEDLHCLDCGLIFSLGLSMLFKDLYTNDKEEKRLDEWY